MFMGLPFIFACILWERKTQIWRNTLGKKVTKRTSQAWDWNFHKVSFLSISSCLVFLFYGMILAIRVLFRNLKKWWSFWFFLVCVSWLCRWAKTLLGDTTRNVTTWFSWTHQILKHHRKHLNTYFHIFLMSIFIRFHKFWIFDNVKNIVYFDVSNHCILEKVLGMSRWFLSLNILVRNTNLKHDLRIFMGIFSLKYLEVILFLGYT